MNVYEYICVKKKINFHICVKDPILFPQNFQLLKSF